MQPQGTGPNQGLSPIAFGAWAIPDLFVSGTTEYVSLNPDGSITGEGIMAGMWNTDHNTTGQPAAVVFMVLLKVVSNVPTKRRLRLFFSQTPIVGTDDASTTTTYVLNTDNNTRQEVVKKYHGEVVAFQLFANTE